MIKLGLDLGTKTIVLAKRSDDNSVLFKHEINGFFAFDKPDNFTKKLLVTQKIPYIERNGKLYALGSKAEQFAYAVNSVLRRPMAEGTISYEEEALNLMASIVQAIIGKLDEDAILYYCIPANAINKSTNIEYHNKIAQLIIESYKKSDAKIQAFSINEARAIAVASEESIVIAISWGAGMVNVCYTMHGMPIFEFSIVGSGDWVDVESAKRFGYDPSHSDRKSPETPTTICRVKETINLTLPVVQMGRIEQTIALHYQVLIENVVNGIVKGFNENIDKARIDKPIPIVMAGGTSSPNGFAEYFKKIITAADLPFEVESVRVHDRPLFTVAEGCLRAAEMHE